MKLKRILAGALCLVFLVASLGGCATKKETKDVEKKTSEKKVSKEVETDSSIVTAPEEFPIVNEKVDLSIMVPTDPMIEDLSTNELTVEYENMTNVHINWEEIPKKSIKEKINLILATGQDMPDVFLNMDITDQQIITYGVEQELLVELTPYIEKYAPNIKAALDNNPHYKQAITAPDGGIYSIPMIDEPYHVQAPQRMWIYKPWLDELGFEVPTTTEEFKTVLKAFKEKDPNGNGKDDEIPLTGAITGWNTKVVDFLMCAFVYTRQSDNQKNRRWIVEEGKVSVPYNTNQWREGLKYLNGLYEEGLLDASAFTQDQAQLKQVVMFDEVPLVGTVTAGAPGAMSKHNSERSKGYVVVPPLKGPEGVQWAAHDNMLIKTGKFSISSQAKNPEVAIRWLDYFFTEEGSLRSRSGVKDRDWRYAKEGEKGVNDEPGKYFRMLTFGKVQNAHWNKNVPINFHDKLRNGLVIDESTAEKMLYDLTKENYSQYWPKETIKPFFMNEDQAEEYAEYDYLINTFIEESYAKFILGKTDIDNDKDWEAYLNELNSMGLERYIEIAQEGYTAQYSK